MTSSVNIWEKEEPRDWDRRESRGEGVVDRDGLVSNTSAVRAPEFGFLTPVLRTWLALQQLSAGIAMGEHRQELIGQPVEPSS